MAFAAGTVLILNLLGGAALADVQPMKLQISFFDAAFQPVMQALIDKFRETNPEIEISMQTPTTTWDAQLQRTILDVKMGTAPDLAVQGYNRLRIVAENKAAIPLNDLIAKEKDWKGLGYTDALTNLGEFKGQQWGLPLQLSVPVVYYNPDLFKKAGVEPKTFNASWDSVTAAVKKITDLGGGLSGSFYDYTADGNWNYQALLFSLGGKMMTPDETSVAFTSAAGVKAMDVIRDFGRAGQIDMTVSQAMQAFGSGTIGMIFTSNRRLGTLQKGIGGRFNVQAALLPIADGGRVPVGGGFLSLTTSDPGKQAAAWKFMKFATGPVGQAMITQMTGALPGNANAAQNLKEYYDRTPQAKAGIDELPFVSGWYSFPGDNAVKISDVILDHLRSVITLRIPPESALRKMSADVSALLPRN
ncbi:ABC transporter substrate-binding protein [Mesorhizobium sp. B4-1-4]|uniref:ABC transporter substrate-binding protein n=1 Tax=Mesorhizobium sp. B4-1-4 TaxID=2589888 RepID=UPI0015E3CFF8|nr:ABC transporter substrate-binding protein [Mesorhizobium sp. B4-1-4]UCI31752.1 ABC transporter substrate-binding protein [Mesorhizobium sp. B4-1-4]